MIILDTNVISEPLKPRPHQAVLDWLDAQAVESLYTTALTVSELLYGAERLQAGKRKSKLVEDLRTLLTSAIGPRILPFDYEAAQTHVRILLRADAVGRVLPRNDSFIAAIAEARGFMVATRDTDPFTACGIRVLNPWKET